MRLLITLIVIFGLHALLVSSHGRLTNPPSRASAWRYGFDTPPDWDDNGNNCGGFSYQYDKADGKCGICGDPWFQSPREHEAPGGQFATGTIVKTYTAGQTIPVTIQITANHWGYQVFKLCANNDVTQDPTQNCFDKITLLTPSGQDKWYLPTHETIFFDLELVLPSDVTCDQCIIQWTYVAANSWGTAPNGTSCVGCGPQENFRACADVKISGKSSIINSGYPSNEGKLVCQPTSSYKKIPAMSDWCNHNCNNNPKHCPQSHCVCASTGGSDNDN